MPRGPTVLFAYFVLGALGVSGSLLAGNDPLTTTAWLGTTGMTGAALSLAIGVLLAAASIFGTRVLVRRFRWARALHAELRPVARGAGEAELFVTALGGGIAEELFFRGMLVPLAGVAIAAVAFGLLHQVRGEARWGWALSAAGIGGALGLLFVATGSLVGCIVAHVAINAANLRFLRDEDLSPKPRRLGGLLQR
ncbi:MAG: CPBP family intramembrane glutamic endopeptidase, partial [Polyangiaceae bacterium]